MRSGTPHFVRARIALRRCACERCLVIYVWTPCVAQDSKWSRSAAPATAPVMTRLFSGRFDFCDHLDLDATPERKLRDADRAAGVRTPVSEDLAQQLGRAVR